MGVADGLLVTVWNAKSSAHDAIGLNELFGQALMLIAGEAF